MPNRHNVPRSAASLRGPGGVPRVPLLTQSAGLGVHLLRRAVAPHAAVPLRSGVQRHQQLHRRVLEEVRLHPHVQHRQHDRRGLVLQLAIEKAASLDVDRVARAFRELRVSTFYGPMMFNFHQRNYGGSTITTQVRGCWLGHGQGSIGMTVHRRRRGVPPPPQDQGHHLGEKPKFTIGTILSGHFW